MCYIEENNTKKFKGTHLDDFTSLNKTLISCSLRILNKERLVFGCSVHSDREEKSLTTHNHASYGVNALALVCETKFTNW